MATVKDSVPHVVRTAHEPRQAGLWDANLSRIEQVNSTIRLLRLSISKDGPPLRHLPGQYIDLHIPNVPTVGGFTITSPPQTSLPQHADPYIELAIQSSPSNPPAAYLWQAPETIINAPMQFRVGGSFMYPPISLGRAECGKIDRAVFVAGGVGINPIMSMISAMDVAGAGRLGGMVKHVRVLYSSKRGTGDDGKKEEVLFEERLRILAQQWGVAVPAADGTKEVDYRYTFFETGGPREKEGGESLKVGDDGTQGKVMAVKHRRISHQDLLEALGPENDRRNTVVYICGLPAMTDEFVDLLRNAPGMEEKRVLCEKWW